MSLFRPSNDRFTPPLPALQWVVDAYALTLASFLLTAGVVGDMFGHRRLFALGLLVFSVASLVCGLSTTPLMP